LPKHKRVKIVAEVWKIDNWNGEEIQINVDGKKFWK
jgi:hypothetical protein